MSKVLKVLAGLVVAIMTYYGIQFVLGFVYGFVSVIFTGGFIGGAIWSVFLVLGVIVALFGAVKVFKKMNK